MQLGYSWFVLVASKELKLFKKVVVSGLIPPEVEKTNGVNLRFSTSFTRVMYNLLILLFSYYFCVGFIAAFVGDPGWSTLASEIMIGPVDCQKLRALISGLASSAWFGDAANVSPELGNQFISTNTSLHACRNVVIL